MRPAGLELVRRIGEFGSERRGLVDQIQTGLVKRNRVGGSQNAKIGHNGQIAPGNAVTVGSYIEHKIEIADSFSRPLDHAIGVFGHPFDKGRHLGGPVDADGLDRANRDALETAYALAYVNMALAVNQAQRALRTDADAFAAANAVVFTDLHMGVVLVAFAAHGTAAHGQILDRAAKAGHFVPLEMGKHGRDWARGE